MDIGADEFEQSLPLLQELVLGADFVGLDIEFTGLRSHLSGPQQISSFYITLNQLIKISGLSVFSSIEGESNKYVAHSCNFFLFPTTFGVLDSEFSFQASSVQFLNQYGFDYNKFLKNGIPYMNEEQEKKIKYNILTGNWKVRSSLDKDQIKVVIDEVTRWLDLAEEGDWMTLPGIAGFQAFEVQLVLRKALPDIWTVLRDQGVVVKKVSTQHRWYLENTSCDRESCWKEKILLSARGFSVFFQMLVKARKPLVGHNMMMDLLHLHEKFFRPLPESYDEFKLNIHNLFPILIDTKNVTKDIWKLPRYTANSHWLSVLHTVICFLATLSICLTLSFPRCVHTLLLRPWDSPGKNTGVWPPACCLPLLLPHEACKHLLGPLGRAPRPWPHPPTPIYFQVGGPLAIKPEFACPSSSPHPSNPSAMCPLHLLPSYFLTPCESRTRSILREYKCHPTLRVSLYRYWRHSPNINCLLQLLRPWDFPGKGTAEWVAIPFSRGSSRPRDQIQVSCIAGRHFTV
ncbi:hypothetical protein FD754_003915 [Muntiacus muntjak]|uniref:Poly(A)-specific ribonuclease PNLDC1 n=1 Tax=Muntiacus muntjak TaxID=9888 RepID=A0A5N3WDE6_MUNMU|nr:hypothetical protein FD754_003915 [Muntiacus muntjak]